MDTNSGTTDRDPSEMMEVDLPAKAAQQTEDPQKPLEQFAPSVIDSVMGTPAHDEPAPVIPIPEDEQAEGNMPVPNEVAEPGEPVQEPASMDEPEYLEITEIPSVQDLFPSYAQSFPAPSKIGKSIQKLNKTYAHDCPGPKGFNYVEYFDPARMTAVRQAHGPRLEKARTLAFTLLEHYYPTDQGFRIERAEFPLLDFGGWRTWIYPEDCYTATKRKADNLKAVLKKNAKPTYETWGGNIAADKFHRILPEHIAGFVVLNEVQYADGSTGWAQHTYLSILMDDLDTFEHWVPEKMMRPDRNFVSVPRADILSDAMGRQAGVARGYAILMLGPRFEFYDYAAKPAWEEKPWEHYVSLDSGDAEHDPDPAADEETSCFSRLGGGDADSKAWVVDVRAKRPAEALAAVDRLFKSVVGRDIEYRGGYVLPGPKM